MRKKSEPWSSERKEKWMKARWKKSETINPDNQQGAENNPISPQTGGTTGQ